MIFQGQITFSMHLQFLRIFGELGKPVYIWYFLPLFHMGRFPGRFKKLSAYQENQRAYQKNSGGNRHTKKVLKVLVTVVLSRDPSQIKIEMGSMIFIETCRFFLACLKIIWDRPK